MKTEFTLNGAPCQAEVEPGVVLLDYLRSQGLMSVKHGCEDGECGACTVLLDGVAVNACLLLVAQVHGRSVETTEVLGSHGDLHPLQDSFLEEGAVQCGYCTPAMLLAAEALLRQKPHPTEPEIRDALSGVLCRCTGYVKPVRAILNAAQQKKEESA
jgi:aerobic-type carbon monoxide dehydrogenase small subunit (CoxS/CutS family)